MLARPVVSTRRCHRRTPQGRSRHHLPAPRLRTPRGGRSRCGFSSLTRSTQRFNLLDQFIESAFIIDPYIGIAVHQSPALLLRPGLVIVVEGEPFLWPLVNERADLLVARCLAEPC